MSALAAVKTPLYLKLARALEEQMSQGILRPGDKLPSVRAFSQQQGVSISTVIEAYIWLENRGAIESRPKSGFFVRVPFAKSVPEPRFRTPAPKPAVFSAGAIVREVMRSANRPGNVPLGSALPDPQLMPNARLNQILRRVIREHPMHSAEYNFPPGVESLRRQISRRALGYGCSLPPSEVLITSGAIEAVNLALRAVARPGDVVAVESPTYFGMLAVIESMGMRAIEIPTHPSEGMSLDLLEGAIRKHRVKACLVMTNGHNPLGYVLDDDYKKGLAEVTAKHDVALIEDNLYGDLTYGPRLPKLAKAYDQAGNVLLCGSVSKVIAPGFRIGWIHAGRFQAEVERLKFISSVAVASLPQWVAADYLASGGFDRYLARLRIAFAEQVRMVSQAVAKYFPEGTRITRPGAGYLLWVELPKKIDALKLFRMALDANIGLVPGSIFSTTGRFGNCIRLSCGYKWSDTIDRALVTLGRACDEIGRGA